jgi:hypothetical protein
VPSSDLERPAAVCPTLRARYLGFTALACLSIVNLASAAATMETIGAEKCGGRVTAFEVEFLAPEGAALEATAKGFGERNPQSGSECRYNFDRRQVVRRRAMPVLRAHLATCWTVPADTVGSSVVLRFMISAVGELRGPPMITATNVVPKDMSARYRETALAVLQKCLPVRPTPEFGAIVNDTVLHLRLVNDAPFPSRNLGPWMTVFAHPNRRG